MSDASLVGLWRVSGTYTNGGGYDYTMRLQQIGSRRGATRLEVFVEGEVRWSATCCCIKYIL